MIETPHFATPFRFVNSRAVVNEQDSDEDILACVETIMRYPRDFRPEAPRFGIDDPTFTEGRLPLRALVTQVAEFEPRARTLMNETPDLFDAAVRRVRVDVFTDE